MLYKVKITQVSEEAQFCWYKIGEEYIVSKTNDLYYTQEVYDTSTKILRSGEHKVIFCAHSVILNEVLETLEEATREVKMDMQYMQQVRKSAQLLGFESHQHESLREAIQHTRVEILETHQFKQAQEDFAASIHLA